VEQVIAKPMLRNRKQKHIVMLLENAGIPEDHRVVREATALIGIGFRVSIICPNCGGESCNELLPVPGADPDAGIHVYRFPQPISPQGVLGYIWEYGFSLTMFFLISSYILVRHGFNGIHVHTPPDMTAVVAAFYQCLGKKFVFDHHDLSPELYLARRGNNKPNSLYRVLRFFERFACRRANRLIATNTTQQNVQIERCGAIPEHCYVVRNGPNESFLSDVAPNPELRQPGRIVLGYVGIIGIQDGVDYMVRVVHSLKHHHLRKDFIAVIVGYGTALADLKRLAQELDVEDILTFTGKVPFSSVPAYISAFDICLTPDPSNPYNDSCTTIKTMEYMALRKPTVCFRTKENEVTAGDGALYASNNDIDSFTNLVIQLMDAPSQRERMGTIARQRIDESLRWERQVAQLVKLYRELYD
jgi:glycosyltransferase involved in cell wall biosynthesis